MTDQSEVCTSNAVSTRTYKQPRAELTRTQIVTAAATQFDREGYAGATVNSIIVTHGLTKGAVYFHFPSKEAMAQHLVDSWGDAIQRAFSLAAETDEIATAQLWTAFRLLAYQAHTDVALRAGMKLALEPAVDGTHAVYQQWVDSTNHLIESGIAGGIIADTAPHERLAWNLCAGFTGAVFQTSAITHANSDITTLVDDLLAAHLPM